MKKVLMLVVVLGLSVILFAQNSASSATGSATGDSTKGSNQKTDMAHDTSGKSQIKAEGVKSCKDCTTDSISFSICQACGGGKTGPMWLAWILTILIAGFFIFLALAKTNLLRDSVDPLAFFAYAKTTDKYKNETDINKIPRPFSLSRVQLGIWTVVIASAYIFLSLRCCGQHIAFTVSILSLMGISAGTAAAGNIIDNSQSGPSANKSQNQPSEGFFRDILSDMNGISIHRFQNVVFMFITVIIFIYKLQSTTCGNLPVLDETLIALNGISTVTYLGLKINENK